LVKREFEKKYLEHWNGAVEKTETGRLVDAFLMPAAPFAAPRREIFIIGVCDCDWCAGVFDCNGSCHHHGQNRGIF